jgi:hypothetical protein
VVGTEAPDVRGSESLAGLRWARLRDALHPTGCQGLGAGAAVLVSPTSSFFFHSSVSNPWCSGRWIWGKNPQAVARYTEDWLGRLLVGWLLGFEGASGRCRCGTGARALHPAAPALQGAAPMAGVGAVALPPPRHALGIRQGRGKRNQGRGLTGGVHMAATKRRGGWQAGRLAVLGRKAWWAAA